MFVVAMCSSHRHAPVAWRLGTNYCRIVPRENGLLVVVEVLPDTDMNQRRRPPPPRTASPRHQYTNRRQFVYPACCVHRSCEKRF